MTNNDLVAVGTFLNKMEAELAHGALEAANIESFVASDDARGLEPGLWLTGVRLMVRPEDGERARQLLADSR